MQWVLDWVHPTREGWLATSTTAQRDLTPPSGLYKHQHLNAPTTLICLIEYKINLLKKNTALLEMTVFEKSSLISVYPSNTQACVWSTVLAYKGTFPRVSRDRFCIF